MAPSRRNATPCPATASRVANKPEDGIFIFCPYQANQPSLSSPCFYIPYMDRLVYHLAFYRFFYIYTTHFDFLDLICEQIKQYKPKYFLIYNDKILNKVKKKFKYSKTKIISNLKIKNFKTLSYEGSDGWTTPSIETDSQSGNVPTYNDKEGLYYNYIKGVENTWDDALQSGSLDTSEFSTQGIDVLASFTADDKDQFKLTIAENND